MQITGVCTTTARRRDPIRNWQVRGFKYNPVIDPVPVHPTKRDSHCFTIISNPFLRNLVFGEEKVLAGEVYKDLRERVVNNVMKEYYR